MVLVKLFCRRNILLLSVFSDVSTFVGRLRTKPGLNWAGLLTDMFAISQ